MTIQHSELKLAKPSGCGMCISWCAHTHNSILASSFGARISQNPSFSSYLLANVEGDMELLLLLVGIQDVVVDRGVRF